MQEPSKSSPIEEVARIVVKLPDKTSFYGDTRFVAIAIDRGADGALLASVLTDRPFGLPLLASYRIFSILCEDRAQRCVDGCLTLDGRAVLPERYLGLWRKAIQTAITPAGLAAEHGLRLVARLAGPLEKLHGKKAFWTNSPFPTFDDFHAAYAQQLVSCGEEFRLDLDFRQPDAPRDALLVEGFLQDFEDDGRVVVDLTVQAVSEQRRPPLAPAKTQLAFSQAEGNHVIPA